MNAPMWRYLKHRRNKARQCCRYINHGGQTRKRLFKIQLTTTANKLPSALSSNLNGFGFAFADEPRIHTLHGFYCIVKRLLKTIISHSLLSISRGKPVKSSRLTSKARPLNFNTRPRIFFIGLNVKPTYLIINKHVNTEGEFDHYARIIMIFIANTTWY